MMNSIPPICAALLLTAPIWAQPQRTPLPINEAKVNLATAGSTPRVPTTLFQMLEPRARLAGTVCDRVDTTLQLSGPSRGRVMTFQFVRRLASGAPGPVFASVSFQRPPNIGPVAFKLRLSLSQPVRVPPTLGLALPLVPGESLQGQLNVGGSGVKVSAPYNRQVWAFEQARGATSARPLGGRVLDMLRLFPRLSGSTVHGYVTSNAYGQRAERLDGPEAWHPVRSRGDSWACELIDPLPRGKLGILFVSPTRLTTPLATPFGVLALPANRMILLAAGSMPLRVPPISLRGFGTAPRFWVQAVTIDSSTRPVKIRNAIGVDGV